MATLTTTPIKTFISGETVTPAKLNELSQSTVALTAGTIVNADVSSTAAIAKSKLALTGQIVDADIKSDAAIAFSKLAALNSANILVGNASSVPTATALTGDVTISNAGVTAIGNDKVVTAKILDANVTPAKLSQPYTLATAQASTSGTNIEFTGIPTWAKRITVMFSGVSTIGSSLVQVRLGAAGAASVTSSGYTAYGSTNGANTTSTTGFITTYTMTAASRMDGNMQICLLSGSTYTASSVFALSVGNVTSAAGSVTLSAVLDRVIVTTVSGTDTFDAGSINIAYEG